MSHRKLSRAEIHHDYVLVPRPLIVKRYYLATYKLGMRREVIYYASNRLLTDDAFQIAGRTLLEVRLLNG